MFGTILDGEIAIRLSQISDAGFANLFLCLTGAYSLLKKRSPVGVWRNINYALK